MFTRKTPTLIMIMLVAAIPATGQERGAEVNRQSVAAPETVERAKQRYEKLRKPDLLKLELARRPLELGEGPEKVAERYKAGAKIYFRLLITNASNEPMVIPIGDRYYYRLQLLRDGDLIPYRKDVAELVQARDKDLGSIRTRPADLEANQTFADNIELSDWYEPLQPGHYQLTVQRRFMCEYH